LTSHGKAFRWRSLLVSFLKLAIHLLIQNLLYDISQVGIPFDRMDEDYLKKPKPWLIGDLARFMVYIGPISSVFDISGAESFVGERTTRSNNAPASCRSNSRLDHF
jgi:hypothetical protein